MDHTTLQREVGLLYNFILIISSCVPTYKELTIIPQTVIVTTATLGGFFSLSKWKYMMNINRITNAARVTREQVYSGTARA